MSSKRTIWKYPLAPELAQLVQVPYGATLLSVQMQGEQLMVWYEVDPEEKRLFPQRFVILGTGNTIDTDEDGFDSLDYVTTVQQYGGALVWHVYWDVDYA